MTQQKGDFAEDFPGNSIERPQSDEAGPETSLVYASTGGGPPLSKKTSTEEGLQPHET